jgi:hypothetical protein
MLGIAVALFVGCALSFCVFYHEQASRRRRRQHDLWGYAKTTLGLISDNRSCTIRCDVMAVTAFRFQMSKLISVKAVLRNLHIYRSAPPASRGPKLNLPAGFSCIARTTVQGENK